MTGKNAAARVAALSLALSTLLTAPAAHADVTSERGGELYSIERRDLMGNHELSFSLGALPLDAFAKGMTIQGAYAYHFSHLIAWELLGGMYSFNFDTGLEEELNRRFDVQPEKEGQLQALIHSNFVLKPLYGKLAVINDVLLSAEMYFVAGPILGFFEGGAVPFGFDYGAGLRMFIGRYFSIKFDIRDYMLLPNFSSVENNLYLALGMSLTFGFEDDKTASAVEVE